MNEKLEKMIGTAISIFGIGVMAGAAWVELMNRRDRDAEKRHNLSRCKRLLDGWSSGPELVHQVDLIEARRDLECAEYAYDEAKKAYNKLTAKDQPKQTVTPEPVTETKTADEA